MATSSAASCFGDTCEVVLVACTYASIADAQWLSSSVVRTQRLDHRRADVLVLEYLGLALHGSRRAVSRVTGTLRLLGRPSPSASRAA